ncbi:MAG: hypothetical protein K6B41_09465 [Butyrivibrio sp.]|nr:hypothetical protein [Butyrivibrio sp.]
MNSSFRKSVKRKQTESRFVAEVSATEESIAAGNHVTLSELKTSPNI